MHSSSELGICCIVVVAFYAVVGAFFVDVPLIIFSCPADHVPDWQLRLLYMVQVRSVRVKNTHTKHQVKCTPIPASRCCLVGRLLLAYMSSNRIFP